MSILQKIIYHSYCITVHGSLKLALYTLNTERDRLKTALESDSTILLSSGSSAGNMVASLRNSLNQALQQNADLRSRLARIHDTADLSDISSVGPASEAVSAIPHWVQQLEDNIKAARCGSVIKAKVVSYFLFYPMLNGEN